MAEWKMTPERQQEILEWARRAERSSQWQSVRIIYELLAAVEQLESELYAEWRIRTNEGYSGKM